uniref:Transcriptional regulator n=1 Tax=Haemonchus contortus TaxID=6289 RepID=A0A7I4Z1M9_HAECO
MNEQQSFSQLEQRMRKNSLPHCSTIAHQIRTKTESSELPKITRKARRNNYPVAVLASWYEQGCSSPPPAFEESSAIKNQGLHIDRTPHKTTVLCA